MLAAKIQWNQLGLESRLRVWTFSCHRAGRTKPPSALEEGVNEVTSGPEKSPLSVLPGIPEDQDQDQGPDWEDWEHLSSDWREGWIDR